jgi:hypothetical protein
MRGSALQIAVRQRLGVRIAAALKKAGQQGER